MMRRRQFGRPTLWMRCASCSLRFPYEESISPRIIFIAWGYWRGS